MEAVRLEQMVVEDGQMIITGLPYKKGQWVEVIVLPQPEERAAAPRLTVGQLRRSRLIGLWKDRDDIEDSAIYARQLREQAQQRGDVHYDFAG